MMSAMTLQLVPISTLPLVEPGDDLASLIHAAVVKEGVELVDDDVVVVTGKVVSKAEGRYISLDAIEPSERAERLAELTEKDPRLVQLVLDESTAVVRARPGNLIVRHRLGYVSAVAGIDRSNVSGDDDHALLLPVDPDASAAQLRDALVALAGANVGVVITDSHGRPFRVGNMGIAIGSAGVVALRNLEGQPDLFGRPLSGASLVPIADLIASAAMLISGEANEGVAVVVVRGLHVAAPAEGAGASAGAGELVRDPERDMFAVPDRDYP